jgi:hypothetical protein
MGHMHCLHQGIRPTTKITMDQMMNEALAVEPNLDPPRGNIDRPHRVGVNAVNFFDLKAYIFTDLKGIISTDLPGRFLLISARGNAYVFVLYSSIPHECRDQKQRRAECCG